MFNNDDQLKAYLKSKSRETGISINNIYNTYFSRLLLQRISKAGYGKLAVKGSFSLLVHLNAPIRPITDIDEFAKTICEKRNTKFKLDSIRGLENRIIKLYKKYLKEKEDFFKQFETTDFSLNIEKYILIDNTYKVSLDYNFKIPYIYSFEVINEVYNTGTVYEDKLIIEYILLASICIKDIEKGNFTTRYIVELANSLFKKQGKLKQTLKVINNAAIQDKVFLKINYSDFEEYKELIYSLIQDGFRFALIIDDTFSPTLLNLKKLSIFKYLLVPENSKNYDKIQENETKLENTVIYDI